MPDTKVNLEGKKAKTAQIIRIEQAQLTKNLFRDVMVTVEMNNNALVDAEADRLCQASRYERTENRKDTRAGQYNRKLETNEIAIIERRYGRRESSVEEALIEMYLAEISVRRVEDNTEVLWGTPVSSSKESNLNQKVYGRRGKWFNAPIEGEYTYVFLDGIWLKRISNYMIS